MTDTHRLCDLETNVEEEIKWFFENGDMPFTEDHDQDTLNEIAGGEVPIYHWDALAYAQDKLWLASSAPDGASGEEDTAIQLISLNICEHLEQHARKIYDQLLSEKENNE